jgi:tetratricopeptide (TPR) repeat protein
LRVATLRISRMSVRFLYARVISRDVEPASAPSPSDEAMRSGMEGLIAAIKVPRRGPAVRDIDATAEDAMITKDDGGLAGAPREAERCAIEPDEDEPPVLEQGTVVGRHVVLGELGAGGMGVVYAAYDPKLDRKIALKVLRPGTADPRAHERLLREAQALAKLSHPNVVAIHDVGTTGEQVWLAMELVQGQTLRAWLKSPRRWQEVVKVLRSAGEGLAAAHAAGMLHRDFKPDNVMLGDDGRVRVMDFGLARAQLVAPSTESEESGTTPAVETLALKLTKAGAIAGTPAYMAPEQFDSGELAATADQFAFCVTLWEALYGARPFRGRSPLELIANVLGGRRQAPTNRTVPSWLRRACERGLAMAPTQRWPSMAALLEALAKGRTRARVRKGLVAAGVLAGLAGGVEGLQRWDVAQRTAACEASGSKIESAWNDERRTALHDALVGTGVSYAETTADKVMPWLDRQADEWREARSEVCLDANVRERWDANMLERSLWCLDERHMQLESLVDELTLADAEILQKAVTAAAELTPVAPCRDEAVLQALGLPPQAGREAVRAVRADVTRGGNLVRTGRYRKALEQAQETLVRAEALQWPPLTAAARYGLGRALDETGAHEQAEQVLEDAYFEASGGVEPEVLADSATRLVYVVGELARHDDALRWRRHAEVALYAIRDEGQLRRAVLLGHLGGIHADMDDYPRAKALYEEALAIGEATLGADHPGLAAALSGLGGVHRQTGDYAQAKVLLERAIATLGTALGTEHPNVAMAFNNLAIVHKATGAYEQAIALNEQALVILENALGPVHPDVAAVLINLGTSYETVDVYDEKIASFERALAIEEHVHGPHHPTVALILGNLVSAYNVTGAYDEAIALGERALVASQKALGPEHTNVGAVLTNLGTAHWSKGQYEQAKSMQERALVIFEKALGQDHPTVAMALINLANTHLTMDAYAEAMPLYERALAIRERKLGLDHPEVAQSLSNLASAHMSVGDLEKAKTPLERALAILEKGSEHPSVAAVLYNLALVHEDTGEPDQAMACFQRAIAVKERVFGPDHPKVANSLVGLARVLVDQRRPGEAVSVASRAVALREKQGVSPELLAKARFVLAQALWKAPADQGRDRARASILATQARDAFREDGKNSVKDLAKVQAWLAAHGGR